jgi:hypothetical protein
VFQAHPIVLRMITANGKVQKYKGKMRGMSKSSLTYFYAVYFVKCENDNPLLIKLLTEV